MNKKLKKSPLTYVLAQVKIGAIELVEKYVPALQDAIRHEFPIFKPVIIQNIDVRQGNNTAQINELKQWHFLDKESTTGVLLDKNTIIIHTSSHKDFENIIHILTNTLHKFDEILSIEICERLGLRYVNVIKDDVEKYVEKALLGFSPNVKNKIDNPKFLTTVETIQESKIGMLKVKAIYASENLIKRDKNNLIPLDLMPIADVLSFDHYMQPVKKFLILDIDHFMQKQKSDFQIDSIVNGLEKLHDVIYEVFVSSVSKDALQEWK